MTVEDAGRSDVETLASLYEAFFKVRIDRLTRAEVLFVESVAQLGDGLHVMADITKAMRRTRKSLGPPRANIISKGVIYSADHRYLESTVPLFSDVMRRQG